MPARADDDGEAAVPEPRFVIFAVISSFVLAELGDKTMLATVALASDHNWAGVWLGATLGMVLADGVAIAAGALLHKRLPEQLPPSLGQRAVPSVRPVAALRQRARLDGCGGHRLHGRVAVAALVAAARGILRARRHASAIAGGTESLPVHAIAGYRRSNGCPRRPNVRAGADYVRGTRHVDGQCPLLSD